jgi:hypothetical protein
MERYAAKLLFQWRVVRNGRDNVRRTCEERTIVFKSGSPAAVIAKARSRGRRSTFRTTNIANEPLLFEFVGIIDLVHLGPECDAGTLAGCAI